VPIRKKGKLPYKTESVTYDLEYGVDTLEIHSDAVKKGSKVLMIDDLLATGGTMAAACRLIEKIGGKVEGIAFLVELKDLNGREKIKNYDISAEIVF
jgi:adenine phosphoribosyltransferase